MSAKVCLYCGKTLVFIRVGAGGDFCSREHRNQYRLRRKMDCLSEANKVSTLARRRETPKALFGEAVAGPDGAVPRAFLDAAPFGSLAGLNPGLRPTRKGGRLTLLARAAALSLGPTGLAPDGQSREFGVKFAASARTALPHGRSAGWKPSVAGGRTARGFRPFAVTAAPGNALRVSSSAGFRLRAPVARSLAPAARPDRGGMAAIGARAAALPFDLRQEIPGPAAGARMAFVEMAFSATPEAAARLDWFAADGPVRREL